METPELPDGSAWGSVLRQITTSSAVNPTMLVSIAAMLIGFLGLRFAPASSAFVFQILILAPLTVFLCQVVFFTLKDPDRLQDDEHVENKMVIAKSIGMMKDGKPIEVKLPANKMKPVRNPRLGDQQ
jgi:hypothetical protein